MSQGTCFFIGMMGCGKTTIGRKLSKRLGLEFIDLDHEIENRTGVSIPTIFEIEGEAGFRQRESRVLGELKDCDGLLIATGGGVVLSPLNRAVLTGVRPVVYLQAAPELLYSRVRHDRTRPLLQVSDPLGKITELVRKRDPLYREVADIVVAAGSEPGQLLGYLEQEIKQHG
jgi:shikimate kinase